MAYPKRPLKERLEAKGRREGECLVWTGARTEDGYGRIQIDGKGGYAHRASWMVHYGSIPDDLDVLHSCDNPPCFEREHLFLGTQAINNADMIAKGRARAARGEEHGLTRLTGEHVREIRRLRSLGETQASLASRFRVSRRTVQNILNGVVWAHA